MLEEENRKTREGFQDFCKAGNNSMLSHAGFSTEKKPKVNAGSSLKT